MFVSLAEAANYLGVMPSEVEGMVERGELLARRGAAGQALFALADVLRLRERRRQAARDALERMARTGQ